MIGICKHLCINFIVKVLLYITFALKVDQVMGLAISDRRGEFVIPRGWVFCDPETVKALGNPNAALIFHKVKAWVETNARAGRNRYGKQNWSFNSHRQWAEDEFSWLHIKTVGKTLKTLVDGGWLVSEKHKADGTLRYTVGNKALPPHPQLAVPPPAKRTTNNKSLQKLLRKTSTAKTTAATNVKKATTPKPPTPAPVAAAAESTLSDSGEFDLSKTIPEARTFGGERNEAVDAPLTPANMGASNTGDSVFQAVPGGTPRKNAPTPLPPSPGYDVPEWARGLDFREADTPGGLSAESDLTPDDWTEDAKREARLFFATTPQTQLAKMFATYTPGQVLGWIVAAGKMPGLTNAPGYVVRRLQAGDMPPVQPAGNPYTSGKYAGIIQS